MVAALDVLANKFKDLKIVKIKSTAAVENWPDKNLPALFMYHEGSMQHQVRARLDRPPATTKADARRHSTLHSSSP